MIFRSFFLILLFFNTGLFCQSLHPKTVDSLYSKIVESIGNIHPRPPTLIIKNTKGNPASYNPKKKTISIEEKVLEIDIYP